MADELNKSTIQENLFDSIKTIAQNVIKQVSFNKTDKCTIVDASKASNNKYYVDNGNVQYWAYTSNGEYKEGDRVYVLIPNGDYDENKTIIDKIPNGNDDAIKFTSPLEDLVEIESINILEETNAPMGILANIQDAPVGTNVGDYINNNYKLLAKLDASNNELIANGLNGFNRLGLSATFRTLFAQDLVSAGEYALHFIIQTDEEYEEGSETKNKEYNLVFSSNNFYGDIYHFGFSATQEALLDLSPIGDANIQQIEIRLYQSGTFKYIEDGNEYDVPYQDDDGRNLLDNILLTSLTLSFGYDISGFDGEQAILFASNNSLNYSPSDLSDKTIKLRWLHETDDGIVCYDNAKDELAEGYSIRWYRYELGAEAADQYSGIYWKSVNDEKDSNKFEYIMTPQAKEQTEQVKVIILYDTFVIRSNIVTFENDVDVTANKIKNYSTTLILDTSDGSGGNYFIYNQANAAMDSSINNIKYLQVSFDYDKGNQKSKEGEKIIRPLDKSVITPDPNNDNKQYITFTIPVRNTMLNFILDNTYILGDIEYLDQFGNEEEQDKAYFERFKLTARTVSEGQFPYYLEYTVKNIFYPSASNNTVRCEATVGIDYVTTFEFNFGTQGTAGLDYTFVIDYHENGKNSIIGNKNNNNYVWEKDIQIDARMLDSKGQDVGFTNGIAWRWYNPTNAPLYEQIKVGNQIYANYNNTNNKIYYQGIYQKIESIYSEVSIECSSGSIVQGKIIQINSGEEIELYKKENDEYILVTLNDLNIYNQNNYNINNNGYLVFAGDYPDIVLYLKDSETPIQDKSLYGIKDFNIVHTAVNEDSDGLTSYYVKLNEPGSGIIDTNDSHLHITAKTSASVLLNPVQDSEDPNKNLSFDDLYILQATTKWGGYTIDAYLPIRLELNGYKMLTGADKIYYMSDGTINYSPDEYTTRGGGSFNYDITPSGLTENYPTMQGARLKPKSIFINGLNIFGVQAINSNDGVVWTQPILMLMNYWPSGAINSWDGSLTINEQENYILSKWIGAGSKAGINQFTGVVMGDMRGTDAEASLTTHTGLYGFKDGAQIFAFKDDGTAFIGGPRKTSGSTSYGGGRIEFDGNNAIIKSYDANNSQGMEIDLDDGIIYMRNGSNKFIQISTQSNNQYPFNISNNFTIDWKGSLIARDGEFRGKVSGALDCTQGIVQNLQVTSIAIGSGGGRIAQFKYMPEDDSGYIYKTEKITVLNDAGITNVHIGTTFYLVGSGYSPQPSPGSESILCTVTAISTSGALIIDDNHPIHAYFA